MTGPTTFKAVKDNAVSTTTTNYGATGVTSTTVATGQGALFPSVFPFRLDIWTGVAGSDPTSDANYEQVTVSARTGDVLTHSATTKTHSASPQINVMLPQDAADVKDTQDAVNNLEGGNLPFNAVSTSSTLPTTGVEYGLSGNITATLPVVSAGKYYMLKKTDTAANTVTLQGSGGALIEGASTYLMTYQNQSVFLVFDGTNWQVMAIQVPGLFGLVQNEVPGGLVNSSNTAFTTASKFQTGSLRVYRNGQRLKGGGADFTEGADNQSFTMVSAPATGAAVLIDYNIYNATFMQGSNSTITNEQPTGTLNGSNTSFICARAYIASTLEVMLDGRILKRGTDYTETTPGSGTFTMTVAPQSVQELLVNYQFNLNPSSNADAVDGLHASATPTAGQLYPLNGSGYFPTTIISNPYEFRVYRAAAQNTASAAFAVVNFDTRDYDIGSNVDITTNKGRFTAPVAGKYHFDWLVSLSGNTGSGGDNSVVAALYKNGSAISYGTTNTTRASTATTNTGSGGSDTISLAAGDYVEVYFYFTATGAFAIQTGAAFSRFAGHLVSAT